MDTAERTLGRELRQRIATSFHRQHLEATGRLLASIAHDVRSAASSIIYSADFLDERGDSLREEVLRATARDIAEASRRLQLTVDSLLDCARLGPSISVPVSLREVMQHAQGLLRSFHRDGGYGLRAELGAGAEWVRGNPVVVEQIFVNLLLAAAECVQTASVITLSASSVAASAPGQTAAVEVRVSGDGAALAQQFADTASQASLEEPTGPRLAVADAEAAALTQGGRLRFQHDADGLSFVVRLPRSEGPR